MRHSISILALCAGLAPFCALAQEAEVIHWWTSAGESQAVRAFADAFAAAGGTWVDSAVAGASAARQAATTRIVAGDPPAGAQFNTGKEFEDLAAQGLLVDLSAVAEQGNWAATTPEALLTSVKSDGKVFAMPVSIHGRNWIWYNKGVLDAAGVAVPPTGWGEDMFAALDAIKAAGKVPLAQSGTPSYEASLFDSILLDIGGSGLWYGLYRDGSDEALASAELRQAFETFARLRGYVDPGAPGRAWNEAANMVITGEAGFATMGDWAKAEFAAAGKVVGVDYGCILPDGVIQIGGDVFVFPVQSDASKTAGQDLLIRTLASAEALRAFSAVKGGIPPRSDVDMSGTDACAEAGTAALASPDTNVPRLTMLQSSAVAGEIQDLLSQFWNDPAMEVDSALDQFAEIIRNG
jgi:glucose/mannose transport system substrate-binding protein